MEFSFYFLLKYFGYELKQISLGFKYWLQVPD